MDEMEGRRHVHRPILELKQAHDFGWETTNEDLAKEGSSKNKSLLLTCLKTPYWGGHKLFAARCHLCKYVHLRACNHKLRGENTYMSTLQHL